LQRTEHINSFLVMTETKLAPLKKEQKVPVLRFPEFEGTSYKKGLLLEFCEINPTNGELPDDFIYIDLECVNAGRLEKVKEIDKSEAPSRAQRVLQFGDILFQTVRPYQKNNYHFKLNGDYVASTGYAQIRIINCPEFFYQIIHTDKFVNKVLSRCTGTSYPAINSNDLKKIPIYIPTLPEQQKIASFLTAVDARIQLLQAKKEKLEDYKKGVMQQIFSQEIRFRYENGESFPDWEEKKIKDLFDGIKGKGLSKDKLVESGKYKCILYGELYTTYKELISEIKSFTNDKEGVLSKTGDLLVPCSTTTSGIDLANVTALNEDNVLLGGDMTIMRAKQAADNVYFAYYLSNFKKYEIAKFGQGITIVHLYFSHFKELSIQVPSLAEQQKIAAFLSSIDEQFERLEKKIEKSKAFKKGLLQKMFV